MFFLIMGISVVCGLLGTYAGSAGTSKGFRRFGIPGLIVLYGVIFHSPWTLLSLSMIGILSMGYGIPQKGVDSGSDLGRFWFKIVGDSDRNMLDLLVRGTLAVLVIISMLYAPIISGKWPLFIASSLILLGIHVMYSAVVEGEPVINIGNKQFLAEDFIVYVNMSSFCLINIAQL